MCHTLWFPFFQLDRLEDIESENPEELDEEEYEEVTVHIPGKGEVTKRERRKVEMQVRMSPRT